MPAFEALREARFSRRLFYTDNMEEMKRELASYLRPGDLVLLKGSRGCALERVLGAA
jgi:UDP-N-acetylmuramyl pentapeptide synthase